MVNKRTSLETENSQEPGDFQPEIVLELLRSFREADQTDEEKALADLIVALDEDRPEGQKLFPHQSERQICRGPIVSENQWHAVSATASLK